MHLKVSFAKWRQVCLGLNMLLVCRILVSGVIYGEVWFMSRFILCEAVASICLTSCFCSLLTIGAISFNRYIHICHNQMYQVGLGHYSDVKMGAMASQITSLTIVYSTVYSGADQRKHQGSASLPGESPPPPKWPITRKMFPFDDVIMSHRGSLGLS